MIRGRFCAMPPSPDDQAPIASTETDQIPFMQRVMDDPFLLLFLGITVPTVLYLLWGVMEVASIPLAK